MLRKAIKEVPSKIKLIFQERSVRIEWLGTGVDVSPWHDVPLESGNGTYNFICEIPKETSAKMEVATVRPAPRQP